MSSKIASPRTAGEMLAMARAFLARKGVSEARLEGELLVAHALGLDRLGLFMQLDRPVAAAEVDRARDLLVRRGKHEPVAYITGQREFYGRPFLVSPAVLIPRPETELLVDRARAIARERREIEPARALSILDIGTGSGCIAITLALDIEGARVSALDVSQAGLETAAANAERLAAQVEFEHGDAFALLERFASDSAARFDLIVSNPPYVTRDERATLAPQVREHEPELALFAPANDADHWLRRLLEHAPRVLAQDGVLLVELGHAQGARAPALVRAAGLTHRAHRDLAGVERVLEAWRG